MEKKLICVSTTPEEMYWELQEEKEQMHLKELARTMPEKDMSLLLTAKRGHLTEKGQWYALHSPIAEEILLAQAKKGELCKYAQRQIARAYYNNRPDFPNISSLFLILAKKGELCKYAQRQIARAFYENRPDFPNISSLFLILAKKGKLGLSGQVCAFLLPNAQEIIIAQHQNGRLSKNAYDKAHARGWL